MKYLYGTSISEDITEGYLQDFASRVAPHLVIIMVGYKATTMGQIQEKKKLLERLGGSVTIQRFTKKSSDEDIIEYIHDCNEDPNIDGIALEFPIPREYNTFLLLAHIHPHKDVDGLSAFNLGTFFYYDSEYPFFIPAKLKAVRELLDYNRFSVRGDRVVLVGSDPFVINSLYHLLLEHGANIITVYEKSSDLANLTRQADFLISAINQPHLISSEHVKRGSVLIDLGIYNDKQQGRVLGDIDPEAVADKAAALAPVPDGIAPLTTTMFIENTMYAAYLNKVNMVRDT